MLTEALRWYWRREAGDVEDSLAELERLYLPFAPALGTQVRVSVTLILADIGRCDEARARLDADGAAIRALPHDSEWVSVMGQLAQAIAMIGGHPLAGLGVRGAPPPPPAVRGRGDRRRLLGLGGATPRAAGRRARTDGRGR